MKNPPEKPFSKGRHGKAGGFDKFNRRIGNTIEKNIAIGARRMESGKLELIYRNTGDSPLFSPSKLGASKRTVKAFAQQKIVNIPESLLKNIKSKKSFSIDFDKLPSCQAVLVRASEFPNHPSEYPDIKENTYIALIEWDKGPKFGDIVRIDGTPVGIDVSQIDNVTINEGGGAGNRPPGDPIVEGNTSSITPFPVQSDYKKIIDNYRVGNSKPDAVTVAVIDTGSLFLNTEYLSAQGNQLRDFPLVNNLNSTYPGGYCSVTKYLEEGYRNQMIKAGTPNPPTTDAEVLGSPYDDNAARHGTTVSAIIAQNPRNGVNSSAKILPVKCFDFLGAANLFDILCGFNYIFSRIAIDNIRIVNASWGFYAPKEKEEQLNMLRKKIVALKTEGVFVVASAGNRPKLDEAPHNLNEGAIYPACFRSKDLDNLISVTTVTYDLETADEGEESRFLNKQIADCLNEDKTDCGKIVDGTLVKVENYSPDYVDIGVIAHPFQGLFSSPFKDKSQKNMDPAVISGSSFAAGYVTAYLAELLREKPSVKTKTEFFNSLNNIKTSEDLINVTADGRYMTLPMEEYEQATQYVANCIIQNPIS